MQFDRDERYGRFERLGGPEEPHGAPYARDYAAPYRSAVRHGYGMGYAGGALRSRGSYQAGQLRSGLNPRDEFEFEWGEGYVGGRGYGGTNYDYEHGYRLGTQRIARPAGGEAERQAGGAGRGYGGGEARRRGYAEPYGPARYGYGPYHERLRRRRRSDEEIREDVEDTLFYDTWVDADRIEVEVEDGVVTLRGTLPDYDEVRYAVDDAWDVDGVRGVRSELKVGAVRQEEAGGRREEPAKGRPAGVRAAAKERAGGAAAAGGAAGGGERESGETQATQGSAGAGRARSARGRGSRAGRSGG